MLANHVDDDVLVEGCSVLSREVADLDDGLRVICVDVEDRSVDHTADVCAVRWRPAVTRVGGESDLKDESCTVSV